MDTKVLIATQDPEIPELVAQSLADSGFQLVPLPRGSSLLLHVGLVQPDLVILDIPRSGWNRWAGVQRLRQGSSVPLIVLLAAEDWAGRSESLDRGADVYLIKPFHGQELRARARALLRRVQYTRRPVPAYGSSSLDKV